MNVNLAFMSGCLCKCVIVDIFIMYGSIHVTRNFSVTESALCCWCQSEGFKNVYRGSSQSEIAIVNEEERLRPGLDREAKLSVIEDNIM